MIFMFKHCPKLLSLRKIWSKARHNALTDLIHYKGLWYCIFRESSKHVYGRNGSIQLISSQDGETWHSVKHFVEKGVDLRDPKLSITADGRLMVLMGGTVYEDKTYVTRQPRVAFSDNGKSWSSLQLILEPHEWLWRVTWHKGKAYGVSYRYSDIYDENAEWQVNLFESSDGIHYQRIIQWPILEHPNEATIQFFDDDRMLVLLRRDGPEDRKALLGSSLPPYKEWHWNKTHGYFGGPNFIILANKQMVAAGRILMISPYGYFAKTVIAELSLSDYKPLFVLPSMGDCSYPGLVYHEGIVWMSYYSSHEDNKAAIYLAKFKL